MQYECYISRFGYLDYIVAITGRGSGVWLVNDLSAKSTDFLMRLKFVTLHECKMTRSRNATAAPSG